MLSATDADALAIARHLLKEQSEIATRTFTTGADPTDSYNAGRVAEACERGAAAIFDALNSLAHHGRDDEAKRVLHA